MTGIKFLFAMNRKNTKSVSLLDNKNEIDRAKKNLLKLYQKELFISLKLLDLGEKKDEVQRSIHKEIQFIENSKRNRITVKEHS